jgi:UPF0755 protein
MPRNIFSGRIRLFPAIALIAAAALMAFFFLPGINSGTAGGKRLTVTVKRGTGFRKIVDNLHDNGIIRERWQVLVTGALFPELHKIKPGRYHIPYGLSNFGLLHFLHSSPQDEVRIMIPNGIEQRKIARIIASSLDIDSASFMSASNRDALLKKLRIRSENTEGYLFPGTYNFAWASTSEEVIGFLVGQFRNFYSDSLRILAEGKGFEEHELLTIASIVEAETPLDSEKPVIASVYMNRLQKNMKLQADPTVKYALGHDVRRLYFKDLDVDSRYNTYKYKGLPPGPICNPGPASILAVLQPAETDYLYFVATGKGGHYFAATLRQHNENIRKYQSALQQTNRENPLQTR